MIECLNCKVTFTIAYNHAAQAATALHCPCCQGANLIKAPDSVDEEREIALIEELMPDAFDEAEAINYRTRDVCNSITEALKRLEELKIAY